LNKEGEKMCGRYYVEIDDEELRDIAKQAEKKVQLSYRDISLKTSGEIYPSDTVPAMSCENDYQPMKWGFALPGKKLLINARFETYKDKPTFKNCGRCLIPASGYFEWKRDTNPKIKYSFTLEKKPVYLAAIFRSESDKPISNFVILTREAVGVAKTIHHRMPVIIPHDKTDEWFSGEFDISLSLTDVICKETEEPGAQLRFD
jgi:putative SOS response-associated peptidase YedK